MTSTGAPQRSWVEQGLIVACVIASLGLVWALFLLISGSGVQPTVSRGGVVHDYSRGPTIGTVLELPTTDAFGRSIPPAAPPGRLVVAAGPCADCSSRSVRPSQIEGGEFHDVVLLVEAATAEELPSSYVGLNRIYVVADIGRRYTDGLNATWTPRFYLLGERGELLDIQTDPVSVPSWVQVSRNHRGGSTGGVR